MSDPSNDIIARFIDDLVSAVLDEMGGDCVRSIFVGGSVAGGEVSHCITADSADIYSDVDLYVVVADDVDLEDARRRCRRAAGSVPLDGDAHRFFRGPDVGVYTFDDLASQPARPGTVGFDVCHRLLFGDPDVPIRAAESIGGDIAVAEALYLLENRLSELAAGPSVERRDGRYSTFVVCKTGLDVVTASLIFREEYHPARSERLRRLESIARADEAGWTDSGLRVVRRCADALAKMPSPQWSDNLAADDTATAVVELALDQWKRIAAVCLEGDPDDWCDLVLRRCRAGEYVKNFRQFRALNARCGFGVRGTLAAGFRLWRYSPVDALRLSALTGYLRQDDADVGRLNQTLKPFLDRLTRVCGFSRGSLAERSTEMYRAVQ